METITNHEAWRDTPEGRDLAEKVSAVVDRIKECIASGDQSGFDTAKEELEGFMDQAIILSRGE